MTHMTIANKAKHLVTLAAATAVAAASPAALASPVGAGAAKPSVVDVVGSGTITWRQIAVLAQPRSGAKRIAVLRQFRPDFRPQYVLAFDALRSKAGNPTWYRISVPGRPNGRTGLVRAGALELHPVEKR